jgi:hypothetical protein
MMMVGLKPLDLSVSLLACSASSDLVGTCSEGYAERTVTSLRRKEKQLVELQSAAVGRSSAALQARGCEQPQRPTESWHAASSGSPSFFRQNHCHFHDLGLWGTGPIAACRGCERAELLLAR